jgi:peptidoglycan/LPS O-acetylase OafA/YrhL
VGSLRLVLAFAVAGGHALGAFNFPNIFLAGGEAVQIFYMISGFLIALILRGKYAASANGNWIFYSNRAVKIFVPYLALLAATVLLSALFYLFTGNAVSLNSFVVEGSTMSLGTWLFAVLTNLFILGQEWAFLLIYRSGELFFSLHALDQPQNAAQFTIIGPAWSLSIELAFYAIAPFILRRNVLVIAVVALASSWLRFEAYGRGYYSAATDCRFFPFELSLFLFGSLSYFLYELLKKRNLHRPALSACLMGLLVVLAALHPRWVDIKPYQFFVLVALLLPALFDFSVRHKWDRWLGELSYPLYLVHWPILGFGFAITQLPHMGSLGQTQAYPYMLIAVSLIAAYAINQWIVIPIDSWRQARVRKSATEPNKVAIPAAAQPVVRRSAPRGVVTPN